MNLEGLEMIAVLVVLVLFIKVLEQFGLFEPVSLEGNVQGKWEGEGSNSILPGLVSESALVSEGILLITIMRS